MRQSSSATVVTLTALLAACAPATTPSPAPLDRPILEVQQSGTTALLQAVSAPGEEVAWVSGHRGTWVRTTDGGRTWTAGGVAGADTLQFRDVHAMSADTAVLLSSGPGDLSRVYRTTDGGATWSLRHVNPDSAGFYDCLDFWDDLHGVLYGDSVDGRLVVLETRDGGLTWARVSADRLPPAQPGEGGFAASGTCARTMVALGDDRGWIATGNAARPRVLRTTDRGRSWTASEPPLPRGEGNGATSVTFRDAWIGVAAGGEIGKRDGRGDYVAVSSDGGVSWSVGGRPTFAGSVYGASYVPHARRPTVFAVGPGGADWSLDDGRSWSAVDSASYWGLGFASPRAGWLVGPNGRIVKVRVE
ncbi:MAG TPA: YCF48-related protein [Gemmatimonadales bacterium]